MRLLPVLALAVAACTATAHDDDDDDAGSATPQDPVVDDEADFDPAQLAAVRALITTDDADEDQVPDVIEELLLRRYRPLYRWSLADGNDEQFTPADAIAELGHAQLRTYDLDGDGISAPIANCDPASSLYTCGQDTNLATTFAPRNYCLDLDDARAHGTGIADAQAHATGLYGHVVSTLLDGHSAYKIEYWQFFAYNNQDINYLGIDTWGDHEGDWTSVQLWFDRERNRLAKIQYLIHGYAVSFAIPERPAGCRSCTVQLQGSHYTPAVPNLFDDPHAYDDNQAEMYVDDHGYKHVAVYIERGGHEDWPGPWGVAIAGFGPVHLPVNPHNGAGAAYVVPEPDRVLDVGEVDHPRGDAARKMLTFDGLWGCTNTKDLYVVQRRSSPGPALHCAWEWPDGRQIAGCE